MARRLAPPAAILGVVLVLAGCASTWSLRTAQPDAALQWPTSPRSPRVIYLRSLTGIAEGRSAGSMLKAVAYGGETADRGAFVLPVAVATGADGRLAVADAARRCVHLYLPRQRTYLRLAGSPQAPMRSPVGLAFDEAQRLFVADSAGRLYAYDSAGKLAFIVEEVGGQALQRPTGIAFSPRSQLLYVVDTLANTIHALHRDGRLAFTIGQRGEGEGSFNFPTHIAWSPAGELYVTDTLNFRIQILDEQGRFLAAFGHHGDGSGDLAMPKGIAVGRDGVVYLADGLLDLVQLFNRNGDFLLSLGRRGVDFGEFWVPSGVTLSATGELYVCDTYNRRVQVFRVVESDASLP